MTHITNQNRFRPFPRHRAVGVLIAAALCGIAVQPAPARAAGAEEVRIPISAASLNDPQSLARARRDIASAARAHCDTGGVAAIYGGEMRRCQQRVIAAAERELQARIGTRLASR